MNKRKFTLLAGLCAATLASGFGNAALAGKPKSEVLSEFGGAQFSGFKSNLVDLAVAKLSPIAAEMKRLTQDVTYVDYVLTDGADRARVIASETMRAVKDILGFVRKR